MPDLTIAIPTYNRPVELLDTLHQLFEQEGIDKCTLMVVDNGSPEPVSEMLLRVAPDLAEKVQIHRNVANIGLSGNLLRCMEHSRTEWLWILADDDEIADHAVKNILQACREPEAPDLLLFALAGGQRGGTRIDSVKDLALQVGSWERLGFISAGLYRTRSLQPLLSVGVNYAYTLFPFIAMIIHGLDNCGWRVALDERVLVHPRHKAANTWALIMSVNGYGVAEIAKDPDAAKAMLRLASGWCLSPVGLTHDFAKRRQEETLGLSRTAYHQKLYLASTVSFGLRVQALVCKALSYLPPSITLRVIWLFRRLSGKATQRTRGGEQVFGQV